MQLKAIWPVMSSSTTKVKNHSGLWCFLLPNWLGFLGLDLLRSILVLLEARNSSLCTLTSDTDGWIIEEDVAGTNLGGLTTEEDPLSTNPSPILLEIDFWTLTYHPV